MIVLGQNSIIESHPVLYPPPHPVAYFSKDLSPGVVCECQEALPILFDQADERLSRLRSQEFLEEIQGRPFDQENLCLRTDGFRWAGPVELRIHRPHFHSRQPHLPKSFCDEGNELDSTDDHSLTGYNHGLAFTRYVACVRGDVHCLREPRPVQFLRSGKAGVGWR